MRRTLSGDETQSKAVPIMSRVSSGLALQRRTISGTVAVAVAGGSSFRATNQAGNDVNATSVG